MEDTQVKQEPEPVKDYTKCPVNILAMATKPCKATISGIATCPECGHACCPVCKRHSVTQLSRVTGYIGAISGFNEAKKQEVKDRKRSNIGFGGEVKHVEKSKTKK